jgi:hypothetical protein
VISNSFLDNGFSDIVSFTSKNIPLKRFGLDSDRTHSTISSDTATATQVNNTRESFNDESNSSTNTFGALKEWAIVCKAL